MLSSKNRLKKRSDINNVFKNGKAFAGRFVFIRIINNQLKDSRFAFVVSKKVSRKAVIRNKVKRQLREIIKKTKFQNGFDFMIIARPIICSRKFLEIQQDIDEIFNFKINKIISK
jgi:ribonuclease P protein component